MPNSSDTLIGEICTFGFNFAPAGFALCGGQTVGISQQTALYSLLGTWFGGDGRITFGYPNLTSRTPVGFNMGGGVGLTPYNMGQKGGFEHISFGVSQMPQHSHLATFTPSGGGTGATGTMKVLNSGASSNTPATGNWIAGGGGNIFGAKGAFESEVEISGLTITGGGGGSGTVAVGNNGGGESHENRMPFQAINFSICEDGIYPSRN